MVLYTNCILSWPVGTDGHRISVMSRHTLNDGVTPDKRITPDSYHEWLPQLAPPPELIGGYYKLSIPWEQLEREYVAHIRKPPAIELVKSLAKKAIAQDITLLCIESAPNKCHRRLLAEEMGRLEPKLQVVHR